MPVPSTRRRPRALAPQDHWQRLAVETPEHVVLDYEVAGLGSRLLAAIADVLIMGAVLLVAFLVVGQFGGATPGGFVVLGLVSAALYWGYFVLFEGLYRGQTPGKKWMAIRVIRDTGHPIGFAEAALRNLLRVADYFPPPGLIGLGLVAFHPRGKRLGDLVAGTVVVRDRPIETTRPDGQAPRQRATAEGSPELTDAEFRVLEEFLNRAPGLEAGVRERFADRLVARFAGRLPEGTTGTAALRTLFTDDLARRQGQFGSRSGTGSVADRFVRQKETRWAEFGVAATEVAAGGLDRLAPDVLIDFAARYREIAADLARARTYRVPASRLVALERAVASGHNALYRTRGTTAATWWRFVAVECPAAVVEARRTVAIAFLAFAVPAALGFALLRERPALAEQVLPQVMLDRAEAGVARHREGKGYFDAAPGERPIMAASIIANNIQVSFLGFAGGIFAGFGSLVVMATNGLSIGAASGHFANLGLFGYLWTFIAGHGVLELFAIWVAGAAGFQLGLALLAPGRLARSEALVIAGRRAIRMVGFTVVLLVIAGLIEGLLSASTLPVGAKVAVSLSSAIFLVAYLAIGAGQAVARRPAT